MTLDLNTLRVALNIAKPGEDFIASGKNPRHWRGAPLKIEFAIYYGTTLYEDVADLATVTAEFHDAQFRLTPAFSWGSTNSLNLALTEAAWKANTDQHGTIELTAADTNLDLGGQSSKSFWLVIRATNTDGDSIVLGGANVTLYETGINVADTRPSQGATIIPPGSLYDVSGEYELTVEEGKVYDFTIGNATSLENGTETLAASGRFTAQGTSVVINGTPAATVSAVVRHPLYPTWDEVAQYVAAAANAVREQVIIRNRNTGRLYWITVDDDGRLIADPLNPTA
jgi:hypothetical protein